MTMARIRVFGISMIAWISLVVFGILLFLFKNTRFVRHLILMGDNESAAGKMGIRTRMLRIQVMALSGFLSGLGAVLTLSKDVYKRQVFIFAVTFFRGDIPASLFTSNESYIVRGAEYLLSLIHI